MKNLPHTAAVLLSSCSVLSFLLHLCLFQVSPMISVSNQLFIRWFFFFLRMRAFYSFIFVYFTKVEYFGFCLCRSVLTVSNSQEDLRPTRQLLKGNWGVSVQHVLKVWAVIEEKENILTEVRPQRLTDNNTSDILSPWLTLPLVTSRLYLFLIFFPTSLDISFES